MFSTLSVVSNCAHIFLDWINDIKYTFEYYDLYGIGCMTYAKNKLSGYVKKFWLEIQRNRLYFGKEPTKTWSKIKHLLFWTLLSHCTSEVYPTKPILRESKQPTLLIDSLEFTYVSNFIVRK